MSNSSLREVRSNQEKQLSFGLALSHNFNKQISSVVVLVVSSLLAALLFTWLGFDLPMIGRAYMGHTFDTHTTMYQLYQTSENLLTWPIDLGRGLIYGGIDNALGYTIASYGVSLPYLPIYLLSGKNFIFVYNLHVFLTFPLTALAGYCLVRHLFNLPFQASLFGAMVLAFSPYRLMQLELGHPDQLSTHYVLLGLYALHRLIDAPGYKWAFWLGVSAMLMLTASGYYAVFFLVMGSIILLFSLLKKAAEGRKQILMFGLAAAGISLLLSAPFLSIRLGIDSFGQGHDFTSKLEYSASLENLLSGGSLLYRNRLPWALERSVFIGMIPLFFVLVVWLWRKYLPEISLTCERRISTRQLVGLYTCIMLAGYLLALGPVLKLNEFKSFEIFMPYELFIHLPGFNAIRAVARFTLMAAMTSGLFSALGLALLLSKMSSPGLKWFATIVFSVAYFWETLPPPSIEVNYQTFPNPVQAAINMPSEERLLAPYFPDFDSSINLWLAEQPRDSIIWHYPVRRLEGTHFDGLPVHGLAMLNGAETAAFVPAWISLILQPVFPLPNIVEFLEAQHVSYVLVHLQAMTTNESNHFHRNIDSFVQGTGQLIFIDEFEGIRVYQLAGNLQP